MKDYPVHILLNKAHLVCLIGIVILCLIYFIIKRFRSLLCQRKTVICLLHKAHRFLWYLDGNYFIQFVNILIKKWECSVTYSIDLLCKLVRLDYCASIMHDGSLSIHKVCIGLLDELICSDIICVNRLLEMILMLP